MEDKRSSFKLVDILLILLMILPILFAILIKVLTNPMSYGIKITGAYIYFTFDLPFANLVVTEAQVNSIMVTISILGLCLYLTHGIEQKRLTIRHHIAEWIVEKSTELVKSNMDEHFLGFSPFIVSIMALSLFSSLLALVGLFPPTSDINVVGGWAILIFILITYYKAILGPLQYFKSFMEPVAFLMPLNIINELATPVSMAFRHYGNILSGTVISVLVAYGLTNFSEFVFSYIPFPILRIGLPAVLSIYFDVFSGCLQAYIFAMLSMLYISGGFPKELYDKKLRKLKKSDGGSV